jgi:hypothetical protein
MNKHIVKHIVKLRPWNANFKAELRQHFISQSSEGVLHNEGNAG